VYRGSEVKLGEWINMLIDAILATIIYIVCGIVSTVVLMIPGDATSINFMIVMNFDVASTVTT
jgi:hypothetical protein